jgi:hypothetical protein
MKINKKNLASFDLKTIVEEVNDTKQISNNISTSNNDEYVTAVFYSNIINIIFIDQHHLMVHWQLS